MLGVLLGFSLSVVCDLWVSFAAQRCLCVGFYFRLFLVVFAGVLPFFFFFFFQRPLFLLAFGFSAWPLVEGRRGRRRFKWGRM